MEVEFEKGVTKARYSLIKKEGSDEANLGVEKVRGGIFDIEKKVADYYNIRTTDLPTVKMLYPPKPAELRKEVAMKSIKDKLIRKKRKM